MVATVAGIHLGIDTHANRPAANTVPDGSIYSCSTHSLIYKSNYAGNSWSTWATLGSAASGSITASGYTQSTAKLLGRSTASTGAIEEITVGSGLSLSAGSLTATGGAAGALAFLEAHTAASSSSLDFTSFISSTYDTYLIEGVALVMGTDNVDLRVEIGTGGGPTYDTGNNYHWAAIGFSSGNTQFNDSGSSGIAKLVKGMDNGLTAFAFTDFSLTAMNLQSTTLNKALFGKTYYLDNSSNVIFSTWGMIWTTAATAVTALRFIPSSGNIASGTIRIYGVSKT
jgi:hypothetical protein